MRGKKVVVLEEYKQRREAYFKNKRKQTIKQLLEDISVGFLLYSIPAIGLVLLLMVALKIIL
jgi:hypothetical protein